MTDPSLSEGLRSSPASPPQNARAQADDFALEFCQKFPHAVVDRNHLAAWFHTMMQVGAEKARAEVSSPARPQQTLREWAAANTCSEVHEGTLCSVCRYAGVGCVRAWALNDGAAGLAEVSSAPPPALRELIATWRKRATLQRTVRPWTDLSASSLDECADELEAALASSSFQGAKP